MPSQWDLPSYLQPDRNDPTQLVLASMQMGAQQAERKRQFALEVERFHLQQQQANVNMAHTSLLMKHELDKTEDDYRLAPWYKEISNGNLDAPMPDLTTMEKRIQAEQIKSSALTTTTEGQARLALMNDYNTVVKEMPERLSDFDGMKRFSKPWTDQLGALKDYITEKKKAEAIQTFTTEEGIKEKFRMQTQEEITRRAESVAAIRADATLEGILAREKTGKLSDMDAIEARSITQELRKVHSEILKEQARGGMSWLGGGSRKKVLEQLQQQEDDLKQKLNDIKGLAADSDSGLKKIKNDSDFEKLSSGEKFIDPEGNIRIKP